MRQADDWYRHDSRAFLEGVQGMGPELIGAYIVILDIYYSRGGDMPRDDRHLSGVLGCSLRKAAALTNELIDLGKIKETEGKLLNTRAQIELEKRRNERMAQPKRGRNDAETTLRHNCDTSENTATSNENNGLEPKKRREEKRETTSLNLVPSGTAQKHVQILCFEKFWDIFPHRDGRKRNRKTALKKYTAAVKAGTSELEILAGVERMKNDPRVKTGYARDPTTWLNQEGWADEVADTPANGPGKLLQMIDRKLAQ